MLRILEILIEGFFLYLLYKLIFNFIIPVYRSTKKVRKHMQDMQSRMNDHVRGNRQDFSSDPRYRQQPEAPAPRRPDRSAEEGEYIDFEEVK